MHTVLPKRTGGSMGGPVVPRVTVHQITAAGGIAKLIIGLVETVRANPQMELREKAVAALRSLAVQQNATESVSNPVLIAETGLPPLVELLKSGSTLAQTHAAATLAIVSRCSEAHPLTIAKLGGIEYLVGILRSGANSAQEQAAATVASISRVAANQLPIIQAGAIAPLVQLLKTGSSEAQMHAAEAVGNLARQPEGQELVQKANGIPKLLVLLGSGAGVEVARALALLAHENESIQKEVCMLDGIAQVLALLSGINTDAQTMASLAIAELASGANGKNRKRAQDAIAKAGGIGPLLQLTESRYPLVVCESVNAIAMVARGHRANQEIIASMGGIKPLVELIQASRDEHVGGGTNPDFVQANACLALSCVCRNNEPNQSAVADLGALPRLAILCKPTQSASSSTALLAPANGAAAAATAADLVGPLREAKALAFAAASNHYAPDKAFPVAFVAAEAAGALWSLSEGHEANKVSIAGSQAIPTLVGLLGSPNERAQRHGGSALVSLSIGQLENQEQVSHLLVELLSTTTDATQKRAAKTLWRVVKDNSEHEVAIAKAGGADNLVLLLRDAARKPSTLEAKAYALWALSLCIDETNHAKVSEAGGIPPLVATLVRGDVLKKEQAACALAKLGRYHDDARAAIARAGGVEPLISLLDRCDAEASELSQQHAAAALSELALLSSNKRAIERAGGISPLVTLLWEQPAGQPESVESKRHAAAALARLSTEDPVEVAAAAAKALMEAQVDEDEAERGDEAAAERIRQRRYTREHEKKKPSLAEQVADAGAIAPLVKLLSGSKSTEAQAEAAGALWALADHAINRLAITENGGIGPLVALLGCEDPSARKHAEGALVRLSIEISNRSLIIKQLVSMLYDSGTGAQEQAAAALANLARDSTDNRTSIVDAGGIPPLLALMRSSSNEAKEKTLQAITQLAHNSASNQLAIAAAGGIPLLVQVLTTSANNSKEVSAMQLCALAACAVWRMTEANPANQEAMFKAGVIVPLVSVLASPLPEMQSNAAAAIASLARDNTDNQAAIARAGGIVPLCTLVRDGSPDTKDQSASALWALASNNAPNKATIAKLGGIEPLVGLLMYAQSETSSINAAGALSALAAQHSDNRLAITKRLVAVLSMKATPARASRLLSALAALCDSEPTNQVAIAKAGGVQHLIVWLSNPDEGVQTQAARAMLAVVSNNMTTQALVGKLGGIPHLVALLAGTGLLETREHASCALWHLASIEENRAGIVEAGAIPHLVNMLVAAHDRMVAAQLATLLLCRLGEGSGAGQARALGAIAVGIGPLVRLLRHGNEAVQQTSAATLAAIALVKVNRDPIARAGAIRPLIKLLSSTTLGTPETAARALAHLARDSDDLALPEVDGETGGETSADATGVTAVADTDARSSLWMQRDDNDGGAGAGVAGDGEGESAIVGGEARRALILFEGGVKRLVEMLDGSNLPTYDAKAAGSGWAKARIGVAGTIELTPIFPGSQVDFGVRIGMQEQGAATLADLAQADETMQDAIISAGAVRPLLELTRLGSPVAQEHAARVVVGLCEQIDNQRIMVAGGAILDLTMLLKHGSAHAMEAAAAGISSLCRGAVLAIERKGINLAELREEMSGAVSSGSPSRAAHAARAQSKADSAAEAPPSEAAPAAAEMAPAELEVGRPEEEGCGEREEFRLQLIADAGGIIPLVKLLETGTVSAKEKAAAALWHLALDPDNRGAIAINGGIKPLVSLLEQGTPSGRQHASAALTRLAMENVDNQSQIAKRLVGLLDHDDAGVVQRAAHDLQALAKDHPGAPVVIVNAGAIMPLVTVLSNGKTDEGRTAAAKTLHVLANSGPANQLAIAIGLVALLGAGTDQAQEYVTDLLLTLSTGSSADPTEAKHNRTAIANAGPFKMLVFQLRSESPRVKLLAVSLMATLSGDSEANVSEIAKYNGIKPLVALLEPEASGGDAETQRQAAVVLADMARVQTAYGATVAKEGGIPLLVDLLRTSSTIEAKAEAAGALSSLATEHAREMGEAGAIEPLVDLLRSDATTVADTSSLVRPHAQLKAAGAIAGLAAGGTDNQDKVKAAGGIELLVDLLKHRADLYPERMKTAADRLSTHLWNVVRHDNGVSDGLAKARDLHERVQAQASLALARLADGNAANQSAVTACGGVALLIALVSNSAREQPREEAAGVLWSLAVDHPENQAAIAAAGGIEALVDYVGQASDKGQLQVAKALAALALSNRANQERIAELSVELLRNTKAAGNPKWLPQPKKTRATRASMYGGESEEASGPDERPSEEVSVASRPESPACSGPDEDAESYRAHIGPVADADGGPRYLLRISKEIANTVGTASAAAALSPHMRASGASTAPSHHTASAPRRSSEPEPTPAQMATREKAARAISLLSRAHPSNQDALARSGAVVLATSLLQPKKWNPSKMMGSFHKKAQPSTASRLPKSPATLLKGATVEKAVEEEAAAEKEADELEKAAKVLALNARHATQKELCASLWSLTYGNASNQGAVAEAGGIPLLIALLSSHPDIHRDAAGALWSLAADANNRRLIAEANGIPQLVELLKPGKLGARSPAQETAAGALHSLAARFENRAAIAEAGGIELLIPLFEGASAEAKTEVEGALLELGKDNLSNQFSICNKLVALIAKGPDNAAEACADGSPVTIARVEAQEHATRVINVLSLDRDHRESLSSSGAIYQLIRQLKGGSQTAQVMAASALTQIARMSPELRIQVVQHLVGQLSATDPNVRQRAGTALRDMNTKSDAAGGSAMDDAKAQREAAMAGGVAPLVELLKDGLNDHRVEAQEYSLWSLSLTTDASRRQTMVEAGVITPLVQSLSSGQLSEVAQQHAAMVLSCLAIDRSNHDEILECGAIAPLVGLIKDAKQTLGAKKNAAIGLARLALSTPSTQERIFHAGAVPPLVAWLGDGSLGPPETAASTLADLCNDANAAMQARLLQAGAIGPLVAMLHLQAGVEQQRAAGGALAILAEGCPSNMVAIAHAGGIPPLVELLRSGKVGAHKNAAHALAMLAGDEANKMQIARAGGIPPLVALLSTGDASAQQYAAKALEWLARDCVENQIALANERASAPLVGLLGSESLETQASAVTALLCLASHPESRDTVVQRLVAVLEGRDTAAQLKASEALSALSARSASNRHVIVTSGAVEPLVRLLGNGQSCETNTPPERAAAVLADLARLPEAKVRIAQSNGICAFVTMLSSSSAESQTHAAVALCHLSASAENKGSITALDAIPLFVALLARGTSKARTHAAGALWNLATSAEVKCAIVQANGIGQLVLLLGETELPEARESAAAVISELTRSNKGNLPLIADAGAIPPLVVTMCEGTAGAQKHATCALWGLTQEKTEGARYRTELAKTEGAVARLVELLKGHEGETQGFAAATLVGIAQDEEGQEAIRSVGGAGPLMSLALGGHGWLRGQAVEVL